jgi:hypothetical protein
MAVLTMRTYHGVARPGNSNRRCSGVSRPLPYGAYLCSDGSAVLFDRRYQPMFRADRNGRVTADDPRRWVDGILGKVWFFDDTCSPRRNPETRRRVTAIHARWRAAAAGMHVPAAELLRVEWIFNCRSPLAA